MKQAAILAAAWVSTAFLSTAFLNLARAAEPAAIVEKAIQAAGGKEKLEKQKVLSWKTKGKLTIEGGENPFSTEVTVQGLDHMRTAFKAEFSGMPIEGVTVVAGDKAWRQFGGVTMEIVDDASLTNEKRSIELQVLPTLLTPLAGGQYKLASGGEATIDGAAADAVVVTPPRGKEFTIYFSRETGLPIGLKAKILDFTGAEFEQETRYSNYAEMNGIQKAKKIVALRDGQPFLTHEVEEFQSLESAPEGTFAAPK
jgi:hypothetical protein